MVRSLSFSWLSEDKLNGQIFSKKETCLRLSVSGLETREGPGKLKSVVTISWSHGSLSLISINRERDKANIGQTRKARGGLIPGGGAYDYFFVLFCLGRRAFNSSTKKFNNKPQNDETWLFHDHIPSNLFNAWYFCGRTCWWVQEPSTLASISALQ